MTDEQAAVIAKEIMKWIGNHCIKLEFSVTHASVHDAITEIIERMSEGHNEK